MNAVLWVGMITGGWLLLSVLAGLVLAIGAQLRRSFGSEPISPPGIDVSKSPGPPLRVVPSLPQQRSAAESSGVLRLVR